MGKELSGKTVLITGSGKGLGQALAVVFARNEYNLVLNPHHPSKDKNTNEIIGYYRSVPGDIRLCPVITQLKDVVLELGGIDILINNAAIYQRAPFSGATFDEYQAMINTNLLAPIRLTMALWPIFVRQESGLIVNINSVAGQTGSDRESAYCASKFGLRGFSQSIQKDATKIGVKVLDVFLGAMKSNMTKGREDWEKLMEPRDVANQIFDLCTDYESLQVSEIIINRRLH